MISIPNIALGYALGALREMAGKGKPVKIQDISALIDYLEWLVYTQGPETEAAIQEKASREPS